MTVKKTKRDRPACNSKFTEEMIDAGAEALRFALGIDGQPKYFSRQPAEEAFLAMIRVVALTALLNLYDGDFLDKFYHAFGCVRYMGKRNMVLSQERIGVRRLRR
jgi:hypothetical protein